MNAWTKTISLLLAAGGLSAAVVSTRPQSREVALLSDVGKPLAPALTDPLAVKSLEVISYDDKAARVRAFKVAFDGKRWVIPSHANYPADAADRMARAAAAFAGLLRDRIVTDNKADHARLGVLAPDDETAVATSAEGVGTRVTLRDGSDRPLADLILGKNVDAPEESNPFAGSTPRRFVREVNSDRVYVTTLDQGFSTKFIDWVETDLLKLDQQSVVSLFVDRYKIDDQTMQLTDVQRVTLTRPPAAAPADPAAAARTRPWTFTSEPGGGLSPGHQLVTERIDQVLSTLGSTRIVGVRRKPENLAKVLAGAANQSEATLGLSDQLSLQTRGFYLNRDGRVLAGDGQMTIRCDDGLVYMLWFGSAVPEGEDAASGGQVGGTVAAATAPAEPGKGVPRYVLITALFDEAVLPEPPKSFELIAAEKAAEGKPADSPEAAALAPLASARAAALAARTAKLDAGRTRAEGLSKRFAEWYYVIDGTGVDRLRPTREELQRPIPANKPVELPNGMRVEPVDKPPFEVKPDGSPATPPGGP